MAGMNFEWLPFPLPQTLTLQTGGNLGVDSKAVRVSRGPHLELVIEADADGVLKHEAAAVPGTKFTGVTIKIDAPPGEISGYKRLHGKTEKRGDINRSYVRGKADAVSVVFRSGAETEASNITEWLANVPARLWARSSERQRVVTVRRQRDDAKVENQEDIEMGGADYICLTLGLPSLDSVLVGTVPPEFVTEGVKIEGPGFIEYRRGTAGLPDETLRRTVVRALEFLFGSGLGVLGRSEFAADGRLLRAEYVAAYIPGGAGAGHRPALLHSRGWLDGLDEAVITPILQRFIELEPSYHLNRAIWLYLHGRNCPLEMAAGYTGAAFEILRRGFYNQPENEARSRLMPKEAWQFVGKEIRRVFGELASHVQMHEFSGELQEIERRLAELNKVSGAKLSKLFLADLQLQYGDIEIQALNARNEAAHAVPFGAAEGFEKLQSYRALHTLFARALLRLLAVEVYYFDYSALGHPPQRLETRQGTAGTESRIAVNSG